MSQEHQIYDIIIIGGGIYGAWSAREATLRGLKTLLVEQGDWGGATSQSSSKLLHGGLRYLEQFEFGLVRKSLKERDLLYEIAPHLVKPLRFMVPIYDNSRVGPFRMRLGLKLYDSLAGNGPCSKPYKKLSRSEVFEDYAWLKQGGFKSSLEYSDAQTDDARFTYQVVQTAESLGAHIKSYCKASIVHAMHEIKQVELYNLKNQTKLTVKSKSILMATGPWMDAQIGKNKQAKENSRLTKGVHILLPDIGLRKALTLMSPEDGRVFFMIPWYHKTMVGTTDTDYQGSPENCTTTHEDIHYLLKSVNAFKESTPWKYEDVISAFSGLRVLQSSNTDHPSQASREWSLPEIRPGIFRSIGGKLTSAREDATFALDQISRSMNFDTTLQHKNQPLLTYSPKKDYDTWKNEFFLEHPSIHVDILENLSFRYGTKATTILEQANTKLNDRIVEDLPFIMSEIKFICQNENVVHATDIFRRRMPLILLTPFSENLIHKILKLTSEVLSWDKETYNEEYSLLKEVWIASLP